MLRALSLLGQFEQDAMLAPGLRTPDSGARSPYFTPPRTGPVTRSKSSRPPSRSELKRLVQLQGSKSPVFSRKHALPPTPASPTPKAKKRGRPPGTKKAGRKVKKERGHDPLVCDDTMNAVIAPDENVTVDTTGKIHLIQERVRHDPWKMLMATCLLNVTSGRAARPIFVELVRRWPTPQALAEASIPDLTDLLYPLGLFNQRASSLVRFSQQYIALGWPVHPGTASSDAHIHPTTSAVYDSIPADLDVTVFAGAGRYASDSFRIYSDLYAGGGAPKREALWLEKKERAVDRRRKARKEGPRRDGSGADEQGVDVEMLSGYLSDEAHVGEEEWRRVRPTDKELRRYLIWRWGLEGIEYDIYKGPHIPLERDRNRLRYLFDGGDDE